MVADSLNGSLPNPLPLDSRSSAAMVVQAVSMAVIIVVALVGNVLILSAIYIDKTLQTITNVFIINLACADLLLSIIGMPFTLASSITYEWIFGDTWCKVNGMANSLFCIASILTLAAVSVDRYFAILHPFRYTTWITKKVAGAMIFYIWFHALLIALLPVMGWTRYTFIRSESICTVHWEFNISFTVFLFATSFFLPLGVMMFTYLRIFRTARMAAKRIVPVTGQFESREEASVSEFSRCNSQARLSYADFNPRSELDQREFVNKSWVSISSDIRDGKRFQNHQSPFVIYEEKKDVHIPKDAENAGDPPSKDSGFEEGIENTSNFLRADHDMTMPFRTSLSAYSIAESTNDLSSSYASLNSNRADLINVPTEPLSHDNIDRTENTFARTDVAYVSETGVSANNVGPKRKRGIFYLPSLQTHKNSGKSELTVENLEANRTLEQSEHYDNNNDVSNYVNECSEPSDAKPLVGLPSVAGTKEIKAEASLEQIKQGSVLRGLMPVEEHLPETTSVNNNPPLNIPVVISESSPQGSPFASRRRAFSERDASEKPSERTHSTRTHSASSRVKKFSTASLASFVNFTGPNSFRAFSKSSLALMKLRKKKDVQNRAKMRRETKAAKTLLIVVGTFILCWSPHFIGIFCFLFEQCAWPDEFFAITTWLAMLNSACNPVIYGVMSRQFRRRFKQILQCKRGFF